MTTNKLALLSVTIGSLTGLGFAWLSVGNPGEEFRQFVQGSSAAGVNGAAGGSSEGRAKVVVVGETDFNFGVMDVGKTDRHDFVFRNEGTGPLVLNVESTSCSCAIGKMDRGTVMPGESTHVTLEWTPPGYTMDFRQSAEISTSDPDRRLITLSVAGRVLPILRALPEDIVFSEATARGQRTAETVLYSYQSNNLQIIGHEWLQPETSDLFEADFAPADSETVAMERDAKSGVVCRVTLKAGMALGEFFQRLRVKTNSSEVPEHEISVRGRVFGDISVFGRGFLKDRSLLQAGPVSRDSGAKYRLHIRVGGEHQQNVEMEVVEVDPAGALRATIGEPLRRAKIVLYPLEIEVPAGSSYTNRLGSPEHPWGHIDIRTTHPDVPKLRIFVRFSVH